MVAAGAARCRPCTRVPWCLWRWASSSGEMGAQWAGAPAVGWAHEKGRAERMWRAKEQAGRAKGSRVPQPDTRHASNDLSLGGGSGSDLCQTAAARHVELRCGERGSSGMCRCGEHRLVGLAAVPRQTKGRPLGCPYPGAPTHSELEGAPSSLGSAASTILRPRGVSLLRCKVQRHNRQACRAGAPGAGAGKQQCWGTPREIQGSGGEVPPPSPAGSRKEWQAHAPGGAAFNHIGSAAAQLAPPRPVHAWVRMSWALGVPFLCRLQIIIPLPPLALA